MLILCSIPRPFELGRFRGCHVDRHEGTGLGETALQTPDSFEDLVAFLELPLVDQRTQLLQALCQTATLAAADRPLLRASWSTPCQEIVDLLPFEELDLHLGVLGQPFPPVLSQFVLEL